MRRAQVLAAQISNRVDRELEKAIAIGQTLATSPTLAHGDYAAFDQQSRQTASLVGVVIAFRDIDGQQRTNTATERGKPLPVSNAQVRAIDLRAEQADCR